MFNVPPTRSVRWILSLLALVLGASVSQAQYSPSNPSREYIRLADRVIATVGPSNGVVVSPSPVSMTLSPWTSGSPTGTNAPPTQTFAAIVNGGGAVTWSSSPAGVGSINSSTGVYTAPTSITSIQTVTVTATSGSKTGTATLTLKLPTYDPLPSGWSGSQIGGTCAISGAGYKDGVYTLVSGGTGLQTGSDVFEFSSKPITGDVTIIGRIPENVAGFKGPYSAAGLMLRTTLAVDSPFVFAGTATNLNSADYAAFRARTTTAGAPSWASAYFFTAPVWFKLVRSGSTISGYTSQNGMDWPATPDLGTISGFSSSTMYAGFAATGYTSSCSSNIAGAKFDNVSISSPSSPDYSVTISPASILASGAGETSTFPVQIAPVNGFSGVVNFSVSGLPSNIRWGFNLGTINSSGLTLLTVDVPSQTPAGGYPFLINSTSGTISHTSNATLTVGSSVSSVLPTGWSASPINSACTTNSTTYSNGVFSVANAFGSIGSQIDSFEYAWVPINGDATIVTRSLSTLNSAGPVYQGGGVGVMLRTGLSPSSPFVFVGYSIDTQSIFAPLKATYRTRAAIAGSPTATYGANYYAGMWFKLSRVGSTITAYTSDNGVDFAQLGTPITGFTSNTMSIGLVSALTNGCATTATAQFDNVVVTGGTGGGTADFSLGVPSVTSSVNAGGSVSIPTTVTATGGFNGTVGFSATGMPDGSSGVFSPPTVKGTGVSSFIVNTSQSQTIPGMYTPTVTGISGAVSHTVTPSITVVPVTLTPPSASISPAGGLGTNRTFSLIATDPNGAGNISWVQFLVNGSLNGVGACYVHYDIPSNTLYLRDNSNPSWAGSVVLGTTGSLTNGQCTVDSGTSSFVYTNDYNATLSLAITFKQAFAGNQRIYGLVDSGNQNSGWTELGTWTVPTPTGALPSGWTAGPISTLTTCSLNSTAYANGVYTVTAAGVTGFQTSPDSFEFTSIPVTGDVTIIARIPSGIAFSQSNIWMSGVMLRTALTPTAPFAAVGAKANGTGTLMFLSRSVSAGATTITNGNTFSSGATYYGPYWFKLVRVGGTITGYTSENGVDWAQLGTPLTGVTSTTMYAGIALAASSTCATSAQVTATYDNFTIIGGSGSGTPDFSIRVPSGIQSVNEGGSINIPTTLTPTGGFASQVDLSVTGLPDGATSVFSPPTLTTIGTADLVINTSSTQSLPGIYTPVVTGASGSLTHTASPTLRVDAVTVAPPSALVTPSTGAGSVQTFAITATDPNGPGNISWIQFLVNDSLNGVKSCYLHYDAFSNTLFLRDDSKPLWVASGTVGTAGILQNGQCAVDRGASTIQQPQGTDNLVLSLAITFTTSFDGSRNLYALVDSGNQNSGWTTVGSWTVPSAALPLGLTGTPINSTCSTNAVSFTNPSSPVFTVTGLSSQVNQGVNVNIDSFEFVAKPLTGDATIIARIPSTFTGSLTTNYGGLGIMLRTGPTINSAFAMVGVARSGAGNILAFRSRTTAGAFETSTFTSTAFAAPSWYKLVRIGATVTGYTSTNGTTWTAIGTPLTLPTPVPTTMYAGFAVTAGGTCSNSVTVSFDNVSITTP